MHGSSSDWSFRRAGGIICSKTGERLGTIEEEHWSKRPRGTTHKSATFHALREITEYPGGCKRSGSDVQYKSSFRRPRKRSLFFEMGERIRLFSTGSFVSTAPPSVPKTQSLHSFDVPCSAATLPPRRNTAQIVPGSTTSLHPQHFEPLEVDLSRAPSQLGLLCRHCSQADICCPKAQQEMASPSLPSLYSLAPSELSSNEPLCRICHCCWPTDPSDPLISPCRCSGSLQFVHASCLMHWLDISSRKLHRPAICELCLYKYRRRRVFKYRDMRMPECADRDVRYYTLFMCAIVLMLFSAAATVVCFQLEKQLQTESNRTTSIIPEQQPVVLDAVQLESEGERAHKEMENLLSTITLVSAIVFFFSFFLSMYAHVKSGLSFCNYLLLCWSSNLEWSIEEYKQSRDSQYLNKLEELRRKINEKAKKAADEVEPLRSSVLITSEIIEE